MSHPPQIVEAPRVKRGMNWERVKCEGLHPGTSWKTETIIHRGQKIRMKYHLSEWWRVNDGVNRRALSCWLFAERVPVGNFWMIEIDPGRQIDTFVDAMGSLDQYSYDLACVVRRGWKGMGNVQRFGTILNFRYDWMAPEHALTGLCAEAAIEIAKTQFPNHAVMVMRAFPFEYEGEVNMTKVGSFKARRQTIMRQYQQLLNAHPFPGRDGQEGWMWKDNPRTLIIDPPTAQIHRLFIDPPISARGLRYA